MNLCDRRGECSTLSFWQGLHKLVTDYVDSVTLKELASSVPADGSDFCI
jgi:DNA-binding IscR family transcriptional regulator